MDNLFISDHLEVNKLAIAMKFCSAGSHSKDNLVKLRIRKIVQKISIKFHTSFFGG